jgi:hypothetical protein
MRVAHARQADSGDAGRETPFASHRAHKVEIYGCQWSREVGRLSDCLGQASVCPNPRETPFASHRARNVETYGYPWYRRAVTVRRLSDKHPYGLYGDYAATSAAGGR